MEWLNVLAAVFLGIAGVVSAVRFGSTKNRAQLFIAVCFLLASAVFAYLAAT